jgi:hypothetical protein
MNKNDGPDPILEYTYPIEQKFTRCPNCGNEDTFAARELRILKEHGRAGEDARAFLFGKRSIVADQRNPMIQVPMVAAEFDVCVECGTMYATRVNVTLTSPQILQGGSVPNRQQRRHPGNLLGGN